MSEENVEIVRRMYESQNSDEFFEFLDPQVVWTNYASAPDDSTYWRLAGTWPRIAWPRNSRIAEP